MHKFEYPYKGTDIWEVRDNYKDFAYVKSNLEFSDCVVKDPEITILIPTYKNHSTIFNAVESAINQRNSPSYNIVIVNNNNDDGNDYIEKIKAFNSGKIKYYKNDENIGLIGNWNRCVELADASYIVYLHADDLLVEDALASLWTKHCKVESHAAIFGRSNVIVLPEGQKKDYKLPCTRFLGLLKPKTSYKFGRQSLLNADYDTGCGAMFCKETMIKCGGFPSDFYPTPDVLLALHYQLFSPIYRINKATKVMYLGENTSAKVAMKYPAANFYIRKSIINRYFGGSRLLTYITNLEFVNQDMPMYGVKKVRNLNLFEKLLVSLKTKLFSLSCNYNIF